MNNANTCIICLVMTLQACSIACLAQEPAPPLNLPSGSRISKEQYEALVKRREDMAAEQKRREQATTEELKKNVSMQLSSDDVAKAIKALPEMLKESTMWNQMKSNKDSEKKNYKARTDAVGKAMIATKMLMCLSRPSPAPNVARPANNAETAQKPSESLNSFGFEDRKTALAKIKSALTIYEYVKFEYYQEAPNPVSTKPCSSSFRMMHENMNKDSYKAIKAKEAAFDSLAASLMNSN